ncbi:hypothetical protein D3C87_1536210 [compost metagenome]
MLSTGFSEVIGSWNTMEISLPRSPRMCRSLIADRSSPSKPTLPLSSARPPSKRMIAIAVVDLPHPDSPTNARVSPRATWKLTPLTAW